jgi:hypothetical protein
VTPAPTSKLRIRSWPRRTSGETCPPNEIAESLEKNGIKRLPIVHDGQVVGIVSRANLVQVIATRGSKLDIPLSDLTIRDKVLKHLNSQRWAHTAHLNVTVNGGVIDLWGLAASEAERHAIRVAAENTPGVRAVNNRLTVGAIFVKNDRASRVAGKQ